MKRNKYGNDFELGVAINRVKINHAVIKQILENQNKNLLIMAETLMKNIVIGSQHISEEMHNEAICDLHEFRRIVGNTKKANDEN